MSMLMFLLFEMCITQFVFIVFFIEFTKRRRLFRFTAISQTNVIQKKSFLMLFIAFFLIRFYIVFIIAAALFIYRDFIFMCIRMDGIFFLTID